MAVDSSAKRNFLRKEAVFQKRRNYPLRAEIRAPTRQHSDFLQNYLGLLGNFSDAPIGYVPAGSKIIFSFK
jgi:hypothetical protein